MDHLADVITMTGLVGSARPREALHQVLGRQRVNVQQIPYSWYSSHRTCGSCFIPTSDGHGVVMGVAMKFLYGAARR